MTPTRRLELLTQLADLYIWSLVVTEGQTLCEKKQTCAAMKTDKGICWAIACIHYRNKDRAEPILRPNAYFSYFVWAPVSRSPTCADLTHRLQVRLDYLINEIEKI